MGEAKVMELQLSINGMNELQEDSLKEVDIFIEEIIDTHKSNVNVINTLVLDSVASLSIAEARGDELSSQGKIKKYGMA